MDAYQSLFENAPVGMFRTTLDGRYLAANNALARVLGYDTADDLLADGARGVGEHYVDPAEWDAFLERVTATSQACRLETRLRRKDGTEVWVAANTWCVRENDGDVRYVEGTVEDITARRQHQQQVEHLASFPELNPHPIFELDTQGAVTYCNPAAREQFPDLEERGGEHPLLLDLLRMLSQFKDAAPPAWSLDTQYQGNVYELHASYVSGADRVRVYLMDITQRRQAQNALSDTNAELQAALTELQTTQEQIIQQERLRALGAMASGIAHDFNNALLPVVGFTDLLLQRPEEVRDHEKVLRYLETINTAGRDAAEVVNRMREFYRSREDGDVFGAVDLNALLEQVVSLTQPKWERQSQAEGLQIDLQLELGDVPAVSGNGPQLREAFTNLVFNAVDAIRFKHRGRATTPAQMIHESITLRTGTRLAGRGDGTDSPALAVIEISDTGMGMTEEVKRRCLEPFFTTKGDEGTGMGLSMVHGILRRHEGALEIDTKEGEGTTFRILLPVTTEATAGNAAAREETHLRGLRIVAVDDEAHARELLRQYLTGDGHTVELAANGREGLQRFLAGHCDVLITDRAMPELSGDQLAAAVKNVSPETPVIMLTGFGEMMKAAGEQPDDVDLLLGKPLTLEALRRALRTVVKASD